MKKLTLIGALMALAGVGMVTGGLFMYQNTSAFLALAHSAQGEVIELVYRRSSGDSSGSYAPRVRFQTTDGRRYEFVNSTGSNPPSFRVGERVEVLYHPDRPRDAKLNTWFSLWGGSLIIGAVGAIFAAAGIGILVNRWRTAKRHAALRASGHQLQARYTGVEENTSIKVNRRHPFQVVAQWHDPMTDTVHLFRSENLWFDPTPYIDREELTVFVEPGNLKNHLIDLDFLPKLSK